MNYLNTNDVAVKFRDTVNNSIYVDKSMLIEEISRVIRKSCSKYVYIMRPSRFGKTTNAEMLAAYYTKGHDSHELFDTLKIAKTDYYEKHMNKYNVIFINMDLFLIDVNDYKTYIDNINKALSNDICETYKLDKDNYYSLSDLFNATDDSFIFIIDNWDAVLEHYFMSERDKANYLQFLRNLLKDQSYVDLIYMTGVLPITLYSSISDLNMFNSYNIINDTIYDEYFGYTEDEVRALCNTHKKSLYDELQYWYGGYYCNNKLLFNPSSVNRALYYSRCEHYWTYSTNIEKIIKCIANDIDGIRECLDKLLKGDIIDANLDFYNSSQLQLEEQREILAAMVIVGLLSYNDGDIKIPNNETKEKIMFMLREKI